MLNTLRNIGIKRIHNNVLLIYKAGTKFSINKRKLALISENGVASIRGDVHWDKSFTRVYSRLFDLALLCAKNLFCFAMK